MATFTDDFNRSNRDLNGDNNWEVRNVSTGNTSDSLVSITDNRAKNDSTTAGYAVRDLSVSLPIEFTADFFNLQVGRRVMVDVIFGSSSKTTSYNNFRDNGIRIGFTRSDSAYNNSSLSIFDGTTSVATKSISFQYDSSYSCKLEINQDGSGSLTVYSSTGQSGSSDSISWNARTWSKGGGDYSGFWLDVRRNDGRNELNERAIDNFNITSGTTNTSNFFQLL